MQIESTNPSIREDESEIANRIIEVATRLFARKGYAATSVREIVREAKVTNPMLYYYFESKEGLFCRIIDDLMRQRNELVREIGERDEDLRAKVRAILDSHVENAKTKPDFLRFIYVVAFGAQHGRPEYDLLSNHLETQKMVEMMIQEAINMGEFVPNPGLSAHYLSERLLEAMGMLVIRWLTVSEILAPEQYEEFQRDHLGEVALERFIDFFFRGGGTLCPRDK